MKIETNYDIGQWIKYDYSTGFRYGAIVSILV